MQDKYYSIAVRRRKDINDFFYKSDDYTFTEIKINTHNHYWMADPFLFENNNKTYLFYEYFDIKKHKGVIAYSILNDDFTISKPQIIIDEPFHLSFPHIFSFENNIYIMPESCGNDSLLLYRAETFPTTWVLDQKLLDNVFVCDSILLSKNSKTYLLCSEQFKYPNDQHVISCYVKNRLFEVKNKFNKITTNYGEVVSIGDFGIRNAGKPFTDGKNIIRSGQDCTNGRYGNGLVFFNINSISPYIEKAFYNVNSETFTQHVSFHKKEKKLVGVHTYNISEKYEVVDISYYDKTTFSKRLSTYLSNPQRKPFIIERAFNKGKRTVKQIAKKIYNSAVPSKLDETTYISKINDDYPWVFISYVSDPFYHLNNTDYLNTHQNKKEIIEIVKEFNSRKYNVYIMQWNSTHDLPDLDVRIIFGHEPNFERACIKYPNARKIYYGVSTYYEYRNKKIHEMTNELNLIINANIPYAREVTPHNCCEFADEILLIGSNYTITTYPKKMHNKITLIHQSTPACNFNKYVEATKSKEFFFLASYGNALKGIGPLLQYFCKHTDIILHWVGPVEDEVQQFLNSHNCNNIKTYGFQNVNSKLVLGLMERCDFIIYPSGVEGMPGSVLTAMKSGLIPIVTPWASFNEINDYGFLLKDAKLKYIENGINWALSLSSVEITERKRKCSNYIFNTYNLDNFKKEFSDFIENSLSKFKE